jgi:site-specific recombinase XerD
VTATAARPLQQDEQPDSKGLLGWRRTSRDPFEGQWELIVSLVLAHPEWSGGDLFQEVQRLFPGRYRPSQQRTLQLGLRKIRAHLLDIMHEPWPQEVLQRRVPMLVSADSASPEPKADGQTETFHASSASLAALWSEEPEAARPVQPEPTTEEAIRSEARRVPSAPQADVEQPNVETDRANSPLDPSLPQGDEQEVRRTRLPILSIEQAIQSYLQEHRDARRSPKTLEWHQTALGLFQQYLVSERHLRLLCQITQSEVLGWIASLQTTPSIKDTRRSTATIATYARSARALCHWLVRKGHLECTPFVKGIIPKTRRRSIHLITPEEFERLLLAARPAGESNGSEDRAAARNRTILWVLLDTGMHTSQLCGLRLCDVDREHRALRVQNRRGQERWLALSPNGWYQLLSYLEQHRPKQGLAEESVGEEKLLFLSEISQPLTLNAIILLFHRLNKRAGITKKGVSPTVLRDTFAVGYLQAGGELEPLRDLLGLANTAALTRYKRLSEERNEHEPQREPVEEHQPEAKPVRQTARRRRRRGSSAISKHRWQQPTGRPDGSSGKKPVTDVKDGP